MLDPQPSEELDKKSRIYWCATGPFAFLPIHAAGIYVTGVVGQGNSVMDYAISSYTPTLSALAEREMHGRGQSKRHSNNGVFLVSQPDTPGQSSIPGATHEVMAITMTLESYSFRQPTLVLEGDAATVDAVHSQLNNFSIAHFACHATQDTEAPLQSGFFLQDGKLTLSEIVKLRNNARTQLRPSSLAFLSACQTGTGNEYLSEEVVHLAAGMLAAGYVGVVGTMWGIPDSCAPKVAETFYEYLGRDDRGELETESSATALHCATMRLRKELGDSESAQLAWVPYVHFGL